MENPQEELACVVLALTEERTSAEAFRTIDRYFTPDATINNPVFNQIYSRNGRENLKAAYQWRQTFTFMDRTEFNAIMVNKDQTEATLDIFQTLGFRLLPVKAFNARVNYIVRVGLRKCEDGKYRIYRQQDNLPSDLTQSGLPLPQFVRVISDVIKAVVWLNVVVIGHILILLGIF